MAGALRATTVNRSDDFAVRVDAPYQSRGERPFALEVRDGVNWLAAQSRVTNLAVNALQHAFAITLLRQDNAAGFSGFSSDPAGMRTAMRS